MTGILRVSAAFVLASILAVSAAYADGYYWWCYIQYQGGPCVVGPFWSEVYRPYCDPTGTKPYACQSSQSTIAVLD